MVSQKQSESQLHLCWTTVGTAFCHIMQECISDASSLGVVVSDPIMAAPERFIHSQYVVGGFRYDPLYDWSERQAGLGELALSWWEVKPGRCLSPVVLRR